MNRTIDHINSALLVGLLTLLVGCGAPAAGTSSTAPPGPTSVPIATSVPAQPTSPPGPTSAPIATSAPAQPTSAPADAAQYRDDRSDAQAVVASFYNAINSRQYARAYGYWRQGAAGLPAFDAFVKGYSDTSAVQVIYGEASGDAGAGQRYYSLPVGITSQTSGGAQYYAGCYVLHLSSPAIQATPPFMPLSIESAKVQQVSAAPDRAGLAKLCDGVGTPAPRPIDPPATIDSSVYLDDRSDGTALLRSFYNAINRREYLRAYSYWQDPSALPTLDAFGQGYDATKSVTLTTGEVSIGAAAGNRYDRVPATIIATMNDGSQQTFAGCYQLHLASPDAQAEPPFRGFGIERATIARVAAGTDPATMMSQSCQAMN